MNWMSTSSNSKRGPSTAPVKLALVVFKKLLVVAFGEFGFVVSAAGLVAQQSAEDDGARELQHVIELAGEGEAGVGPLAAVAEVDVFVAVEQLEDLVVGLLQAFVVADDGGVLGHGVRPARARA